MPKATKKSRYCKLCLDEAKSTYCNACNSLVGRIHHLEDQLEFVKTFWLSDYGLPSQRLAAINTAEDKLDEVYAKAEEQWGTERMREWFRRRFQKVS